MRTTFVESGNLSAKQRLTAALINFGRVAGRKTGLGRTSISRGISRALYGHVFPQGEPAPEIYYRGLRLTVPEGDRAALPHLLAGGFEELGISVFERLSAASREIFDVGANIGVYSCVGAAHILRDGSVTAFEPAPDNLVALRRNLELNGCSETVRIVESAVGAADGNLDFHLTDGNSFTHSAAAERLEPTSALLEVTMVSVDSYLTLSGGRDPDILKIDVEGYEPFVLQGARRLIERSRPTIFVEYLPDNIRKCGGSPEVLRKSIFGAYDHVFAIDDECGLLAPVVESELRQVERRHSHCFNLLAVSCLEHLDLLPERNTRPWTICH